jgi:hypothetical protein
VNDYQDHLEALGKQAAEAALISALATSPQKRALLAKIAEHFDTLATELERAVKSGLYPRNANPPGRIEIGPTE